MIIPLFEADENLLIGRGINNFPILKLIPASFASIQFKDFYYLVSNSDEIASC